MAKKTNNHEPQEEFELEGECSLDPVAAVDVSAESSGSPEEGRREEKEVPQDGLAQALVDLGWAADLDHARARMAYLTPRKIQILTEHHERTRKPPE